MSQSLMPYYRAVQIDEPPDGWSVTTPSGGLIQRNLLAEDTAKRIAGLMNDAFRQGYSRAQFDIRHALGVTEQ
jgi:hypothetical protein